MEKRGQMSVEYMLTIAFALLLVTGVVYVVSTQIGHQAEDLQLAQLNKFGNTIVDTVNKLSYMGGDSTLTVEETLPLNIRAARVEQGKTLVFNYSTGGDVTQIAFVFPVNVSLDLKDLIQGRKKLVISTRGDYALICNKIANYSCNSICDIGKGETYANAPSDCCTLTCMGCDNNERYTSCETDASHPCRPECYGHNGCKIGSCS